MSPYQRATLHIHHRPPQVRAHVFANPVLTRGRETASSPGRSQVFTGLAYAMPLAAALWLGLAGVATLIF